MWFKNLQLFQFSKPISIDIAQLQEQLQAFQFEPCKSIETYRSGWSLPAPNAMTLYHCSHDNILLCMRRQEKVIPAAVVNEALKERIAAIELKEQRKVGRKEKLTLKEELLSELTPRAFVRSSYTWGYIDLNQQRILIDAVSSKKAEEFLDLLRQTLGSLPVIPINTQLSPAHIMTQWLGDQHKRPVGLLLDGQCELRSDLEEGSVIRCKQPDLDADEVVAHIETGKQVVKLAINWQERVQCVLQEDLCIKRLRFGDDLLEEARDSYADEDPMTQLDADFALMSLELQRFTDHLIEWLGGVAELGQS